MWQLLIGFQQPEVYAVTKSSAAIFDAYRLSGLQVSISKRYKTT
jgi:hypothetical protein